ncbi:MULTISPECIES: PEP/pyruvate-binding domain-containing protein [Mediterraneibacter]|uniref:PEP/pyruvate-binding domain-containing protein n=1 Tax=Mediterraneibacter TaxID=2316020 RepID=UPI000E4878B1|nr:PEP/pyruvate-binding domain-containing protein [Mediterraneibacter massiliensis]RGT75356.1 pyruvate kinase [Ruminococcus sp. AF18-22]
MTAWEKLWTDEKLTEEERREICHEMLTTEARMERLILKNFTEKDFQKIAKRRIGDGLIGGKACGLLTARKLIENILPEYMPFLEPHDSYFIGSDVFYGYVKDNDCIELREKQRREKERFKDSEVLKERLRNGGFSEKIKEGFRKIIRYYDKTPIIVRSSSFLEDGYGNAFSGKYESVFCMSQGTEEERLYELEEAVRKVYASTMNPSALEYRRKRKLLGADEQMALLVQKVEGQRYEKLYMPVAAGMGCSYNPYKWMEHLNPDAGMLRLVAGLGTRAVERTPGDYPRLIGLDRAQANMRTTIAERHKFSQRQVDVLDLEQGKQNTVSLDKIIELLPSWQKKMILSHDTEAEYLLAQRGRYRKIYFSDCQGIVDNTEFIRMMRKMLKMLEKEYERPVDVEFALSSPQKEVWRVNLLQCRPLQTSASEQIEIPEEWEEEFLFDVRRTSMRRSKKERLDRIVWVDPQKYYECPYVKKPDIGRLIGRINQYYEEEDKKLMLLVPGRIGTSSPELGVPVVYADISQFAAICEVAYSKAGYRPELSYGSHMFQDLVEADVYYGAINENSRTKIYRPELLKTCKEILLDLFPDETELSEIVKIYDISDRDARLILDAREGRAVCLLHKKEGNCCP